MGVSTGANLGFEGKLWNAADKLRGTMDSAEYKHVVLGLIFLKYISDAFEERHSYLSRAVDDPKDEYFLPAGTRAGPRQGDRPRHPTVRDLG